MDIANQDLKLVILKSASTLGGLIEKNIQKIRKDNAPLSLNITESFFSSGESKVSINESVRGKDLYIICDVGNFGLTYNMRGFINHCSPYDNYKQIKNVIGAISGQAKSISIVMPLLIDSRQHRRNGREPLSCAITLQELGQMGIKNILTIDVHDPSVRQALPLISFENILVSNTLLKKFLINEKDKTNFDNLIVISPDQGAGPRTESIANKLVCKMGTFSKIRDFSRVVNGKNPILAHNYMGPRLNGKDILVVDDIISSGDSMLDIGLSAKKKGAKKVFYMATFSLFTEQIERFREAYAKGQFNKVYTTNLTYINSEFVNEEWLEIIDCSYPLAQIINNLSLQKSISELLVDEELLVLRKSCPIHLTEE